MNTPTPEKRIQIPSSRKPGRPASPAHNATRPILHYDAAASGTSLIAVPIPSSRFAGLCVLLVDDFLRFDGHVDNMRCRTAFESSVWPRREIQCLSGLEASYRISPFKCALSSNNFPKWINRIELGLDGLASHSREPFVSHKPTPAERRG